MAAASSRWRRRIARAACCRTLGREYRTHLRVARYLIDPDYNPEASARRRRPAAPFRFAEPRIRGVLFFWGGPLAAPAPPSARVQKTKASALDVTPLLRSDVRGLQALNNGLGRAVRPGSPLLLAFNRTLGRNFYPIEPSFIMACITSSTLSSTSANPFAS